MKYNATTQRKAEQLLKEAEYIVRYEKGNFSAGYCLLESKKVVVINKYFTIEAKVGALLEIVKKLQPNTENFSEESKLFYQKISQLTFEDF